MRQKILAPLVSCVLLVSACSDSEEAKPASVTAAESAIPTGTNGNVPKDKAGKLNEPMEISSLPDNDVFLTVSDITVGEDCAHGVWDEEFRLDELGDGKQYVQVFAEVDVQRLDNPQSSIVYLSSPKVVDKEGYTLEPEISVDCKSYDDGTDSWFDPTEPGDKTRRYGAFIVPQGISEIRIEGKTFNVQ
ncbi:hypothetical protein [Corynebacterium propinquum]